MDDSVWTVLGVVLAAIGAIATVVASVATAKTLYPPKRRLAIGLQSAAPVVPEIPGNKTVELRIDGEDVSGDVSIVALELHSSGRADIATNQYDQNRPIKVLVGSGVRSVLSVTRQPPLGTESMPTELDGDRLALGPGLIRRGQSILVQLLVEGNVSPDAELVVDESLIDVDVITTRGGPAAVGQLRRQRLVVGVLLVGLVIAGIGAVVLVKAALAQAAASSALQTSPFVLSAVSAKPDGEIIVTGSGLPPYARVNVEGQLFERSWQVGAFYQVKSDGTLSMRIVPQRLDQAVPTGDINPSFGQGYLIFHVKDRENKFPAWKYAFGFESQ